MHVGGTEMKLEAVVDTATGEKVHCAVIDNNNKRSAFVLTLEHFINAINSGITNTDADVASMPKLELPEGYVTGWTNQPYNEISGFSGVVILNTPAECRLMSFDKSAYIVPFPELVFKLQLSNGKLIKDRCYAKKGNQLYAYPYTNVYNDGHICWGSCELPFVKSIKETEKIPQLFLRFTGNSDLSNSVTLAAAGCRKMESVFKKLEGKDKFPEEWLNKIAISYEDFISCIK